MQANLPELAQTWEDALDTFNKAGCAVTATLLAAEDASDWFDEAKARLQRAEAAYRAACPNRPTTRSLGDTA